MQIRRFCHKWFYITALACGSLVSCSSQPVAESTSTTNDIGTDLPDNGGNAPIHVYWVTDTKIFRGYCPNRDVVTRQHCQENREHRDWAQFKTNLDGGLSNTIRQLQEEARNIQGVIATLEVQIQQILNEINAIERQQGTLSVELRNLRTQMEYFQSVVREYSIQLDLIDQSLAQALDKDMAQLRLHVMAQIKKYQQQSAAISGRIDDLMTQIQNTHGQLASLRDQATRLNNRLQNLNHDLAIVQDRLATAYSDFNIYEVTLRKLLSGIVHPILSDNVWWAAERQFVKRFDSIFSQRP
jgi:predicted  nucleic acid-binding Zn-ribbon protein